MIATGGGAPSFHLYVMAMIRRAGMVRTGEFVAADALIRKNLARRSAAGEIFDFDAEAARIMPEMIEKARWRPQ